MGAIESPESVAMKYDVPFWSDAHWKHLDKAFELLGQTGVKDLHIPIVAQGHLVNEQDMVRWIKQSDGSYNRDYQIVEKYLDTARRHLKLSVVAFWPSSYVACRDPKGVPNPPCFVTEFDPATGKATDLRAPDWGTPEAREFWKPVIGELRAILAKRGLEKTILFGGAPEGSPGPELYHDMLAVAPDIHWYRRNHMSWSFEMGDRDNRQNAGYVSQAHGGVFHSVAGLCFNAKTGGKWKVPEGGIFTSTPWDMTPESELAIYRICAEGTRHSADGWHGIANLGADYWRVLKRPEHNGTLLGRYVEQGWIDCSYNPALLGAGKEGPVPTCRYQLMREAFQESEAVIFVQNALDDPVRKAKLNSELVKRCESVCAERALMFSHYARYLTYFSNWFSTNYDRVFDEAELRKNSEQMYELAGEVGKALAGH
jgi:hypothetical protein